MTEVYVTRNGQITLSKEIRDQLGIREGDCIVMNLVNDVILVSKKDPSVWDKVQSFLPENFENTLKAIRMDSSKRFKNLGITGD
ncbi:MAG: AbrB/MazE/SpoVT family DNA-binding domain-containing protein [Candidatus Micrarchaeota archaeon]